MNVIVAVRITFLFHFEPIHVVRQNVNGGSICRSGHECCEAYAAEQHEL